MLMDCGHLSPLQYFSRTSRRRGTLRDDRCNIQAGVEWSGLEFQGSCDCQRCRHRLPWPIRQRRLRQAETLLSVASYVYHPHAEPSPLVHGGPIIESSNQLGWLKASWFPVQMRIRGSFPICYCAASDEANYLASLGISLPPAESPCDRDNALYHYAGTSDRVHLARQKKSES